MRLLFHKLILEEHLKRNISKTFTKCNIMLHSHVTKQTNFQIGIRHCCITVLAGIFLWPSITYQLENNLRLLTPPNYRSAFHSLVNFEFLQIFQDIYE